MTIKTFQITFIILLIPILKAYSQDNKKFNIEKDLLLVHFDCKTDVDDVHTVAGLYTLFGQAPYSKIKYHAVAGTYGIQKGLYVPANEIFALAFGKNWSDAHTNKTLALNKVKQKAKKTIQNKGHIWIAEAGQSDFSAALILALKSDFALQDITKKIHIVQHSDWNEEVTTQSDLKYVKNEIDYQKIPDGNVVGNGTPGFNTPEYTKWREKIKDKKLLKIWEMAIEIGLKYNGKEDRYLNKSIAKNGLDFSDLAEVCWILNLQDLKDSEAFFEKFGY